MHLLLSSWMYERGDPDGQSANHMEAFTVYFLCEFVVHLNEYDNHKTLSFKKYLLILKGPQRC